MYTYSWIIYFIYILDFPVPVAAEEYYSRFLLGTGFRFDALGKNGAWAFLFLNPFKYFYHHG